MPEWLYGAAVALAINALLFLFAYYRFRGSFDEWRRAVDSRLDSNESQPEKLSALNEQVKNLQHGYHLLHEWKRVLLPQDLDNRGANVRGLVERVEKDLNRRIERLEKSVLNGRRG